MRTFVAVEILSDQIISLISKFQSEIKIGAKPTSSTNLHFTLQFLGDVSEERLEKIKKSLNSIKFSGFKINFQGVGAFPSSKNPRIIWIGVDDIGANSLIELAEKIKEVLNPLGFSVDKPFKPHITVLRVKQRLDNLDQQLENWKIFNFGTQVVDRFKLKKSILSKEGPTYSDLLEVKAES